MTSLRFLLWTENILPINMAVSGNRRGKGGVFLLETVLRRLTGGQEDRIWPQIGIGKKRLRSSS